MAAGKGSRSWCNTLSWASRDEEARGAAHDQWRFAALPRPDQLWDLRTPEELAKATRDLTVDDVARRIPSSSDVHEHLRALQMYAELGVDGSTSSTLGKTRSNSSKWSASRSCPS